MPDKYSVPPVDESGIYQTQWTGGPAAKQPGGHGVSNKGSGGPGTSGTGFQVQTDGMRSQAAIIAQCGQQISEVLAQLRATLTAGGEPWGTDDLGQRFGSSYTGPANQGSASIAGLGAALVNVANELTAQADTYDAVEQHAVESCRKVKDHLADGSTGPTGSVTGSS